VEKWDNSKGGSGRGGYKQAIGLRKRMRRDLVLFAGLNNDPFWLTEGSGRG